MNKLILLLTCLLTLNFSMARDLPNLEGKYFGTTKYDGQKRRVGILLKAIEGEKDNYYGIVMEYLSPFKEKNFVADFLRPGKKKFFRKKRNGYLQELFNWIQIYKFERIGQTDQFSLKRLEVQGNQVIASQYAEENTVLTLSSKKRRPMKKAVLEMMIGDKKISMKMNKSSKRPVTSTWRYHYVQGPYNPGYKQSEIDILFLLDNFDEETRQASAVFDVETLKNKNMKIQGRVDVIEASHGIFIFKDNNEVPTIGMDLIEDKIGVFVDVYDASPIMNTVELILIDPKNSKGSQMYFEEFGNKDKK